MFQKKVSNYEDIPEGYEGQLATTYIGTVIDCLPVVDTNAVTPGKFVIGEVDSNNKELKYAKLSTGNIQNKPVLGVVLRNSEKFANITPSDKIPSASHVNILRRGSVYIKASADAEVGYYVHLKENDGTVVFDKSTTKASHVFTGFVVTSGGKKDNMIIISA